MITETQRHYQKLLIVKYSAEYISNSVMTKGIFYILKTKPTK